MLGGLSNSRFSLENSESSTLRPLRSYFVSKFWKNDIFSLNIPLSNTGLDGRSGE